jgi:hypothetical protein
LQETKKVFLPVPGQTRPRLETKEEQIAVGTEKVRCPMCEGRLTVASSTRKSPDLAAVVARGTDHCANTYSYLFDLGLSERPHLLREPYEPTPLA